MTFIPIRNDNAYFGFAKQTTQGTPVAPDHFIRWLDGSGIEPDLKTEEIWEGDGSRNLSQIIKNGQKWKIKLLFYARPDSAGYFGAASSGASSDSYIAPFTTTTMTAAITAGVSTTATLTSVASIGSGSGIALMFDKGLATEEVVTVLLPPVGNVVTIQSLGTFKQNHAIGATVQGLASHTITPKVDGSYYTSEVCLGDLNGGAGDTYRITDCKVDSIKYSCNAGGALMVEVALTGIANVAQVSPSTTTFENRPIFLFQQVIRVLNGVSESGDALGIEKLSIEQKNALDDAIQTNAVTMAAIIFGNFELKVTLDLIVQSLALVRLTYLGSTAGTVDSQVIGLGALALQFALPDNFHAINIAIPTIAYIVTKPPTPKKDGKHFTMQVQATATSNLGQNANVVTLTVANAINSAY